MKEITTSQYHTIAGGYGEQCGGGPSNANSNGCSSGGSSGPKGGSNIQDAFYKTSNEGSGSGAYNFGSPGGSYRREVGSNR
ncbi:hypothetical protein MUA01_15735 [Enterobacteriaceae bacterium H18W14]|uniref:hypothetical protein n=1 Tax=Dryocola boscaweniae TaxID=2925397 RepID=UPI0022F077B9|nr:hypothetical protein [Dryocola boscaweniae]MCT4716414.1 hypothetical protein [Dryocola boscaweniae]